MDIEIGIGISTKLDSTVAGREAARSAYYQLGRRDPNIIIVFISTIYSQADILKGIRSVLKGTPLIGCSSAASITPSGVFRDSVTVCALSSNSIRFSCAMGNKISKNARQAGSDAARESSSQKDAGKRRVYLMLSNCLSGNVADILRATQEILGTQFPIIGGSSTDEFEFQKTYQYFNNNIYTDSVVGLVLSGEFGVSIGKAHGWQPIGKPHWVTRASANIISEIDKKKAVELYEEYLGKTFEELRIEGIGKLASNYPLGMYIKERKDYLLRAPLKADAQGSLILNAEVPEREYVSLMIGDKNLALQATKKACIDALKTIRKSSAKFAIVFSDLARLQLLRKDSKKEAEIIKDMLGPNVPFFGCYTCGEYGSLDARQNQEQAHYHNHAIVIAVFS